MEVVRFKDEKTGKFGLKYENGQIIIPGEYDFVEYIDRFPGHQTIILVEKNRKWGVLDENGNVIIDIKHDFIKPIFEPKSVPLRQIKYAVRKDDKYGFIKKNSDKPEYIYDDVSSSSSAVIDTAYSYGSFAVEIDGMWGSVSAITLKPNVECKYEDVEIKGVNTIVAEKENGKKCAFSYSGDKVVKAKYDEIYGEDKNGFRVVEINGKEGILDEDGEEILKCKYDYVSSSPLPGLIEVYKGDKAIYVDTNGKRLTKGVYGYSIIDTKHDKSFIFLESYLSGTYKKSSKQAIKLDAKIIKDYLDDVLTCKLAQFKFELSQAKDTVLAVDVHDKYRNEVIDLFKLFMLGVEIEANEAKIDIEQRRAVVNKLKEKVMMQLEKLLAASMSKTDIPV